MNVISRERLVALVLPAILLILALGLAVGGLFFVFRRTTGSTPASLRWSPDTIAPALALRTLAGDHDTFVLDQALEENKLETALVTLYFSTSLSDQQQATYWITLGERYAQAKQKERARFCYGQATSVLLLSSDAFDATKAGSHLTLGKNLGVIGDRAEAERNFDFAYTIARYSPYVEDGQRRFILGNLTPEFKSLNLDRKADEATRALATLPLSYPAPASPAQAELPPPALGDDVRAATTWRMRAAQRLINTLGSKSTSAIEDARRNLEDALSAEDDLRALMLETRMGQLPSAEGKAALAKSRLDWLVLRSRIAQRGFGLSLAPGWEKDLANIKTSLRQTIASYYLLRREVAIALPDPVDAAQARVDLLRHEMLVGKLGLYPDYPENRLISELAQATKERIELREDGLYISVLSQEGRGLLVITTADLWGRPAAMASAGLGMSFPTIRPATVYLPNAAATPTRLPVVLATPTQGSPRPQQPADSPTPPRQSSATPTTPSVATATQPSLPPPTQPTSPLPVGAQPPAALATPTRPPTPAPPTVVAPAQQPTPLPPPPAPPTATFTPAATPTPAYNYQVIYKSGPILRESTGYDNFHIVGMVVDQNGLLIPGLQQRLSWCCPAGQAVHPRPEIDVDNGRFDFFISRGQFDLDVLDGSATTQPLTINTDVPGLSGYAVWEITFQRTGRAAPPSVPRTPTPTTTVTPTGTPAPPSPTPPLPGAIATRIALDPGWNYVGLPLSPVTTYSAGSLQADMNSQLNIQGGGVSQVAVWDGARISAYSGSIALGVGYFVNITGTNRVFWQMTGYPLVAPVTLNLNQTQKTSIVIPYMPGGPKTAQDLRIELDAVAGAGTFVRLWRQRDSLGNWEYYDGTPTGISSFTLATDRGYLLEVSRTYSWAPWQPATPTMTPSPTLTPSATPTPSPTPFDTYEPNNSFDQAGTLTPEIPAISYISYPSDRDYFKFTVSGPATLYVSLTNLPTDYDLYLYSPQRVEIDASFAGGQTPEYITRTVTAPGVYYVLVQGAGPVYDAIKPYKLLTVIGP